MAKDRCVLCGEEVGAIRRGFISVFGYRQTACPDCRRSYESADGAEKEGLQHKIMLSPDVENRELIQNVLNSKKNREEEECTAQERQEPERLCCGQAMERLKQVRLPVAPAELTMFFAENSVWLDSYRCGKCGQVRFYDPDFVPEKQP